MNKLGLDLISKNLVLIELQEDGDNLVYNLITKKKYHLIDKYIIEIKDLDEKTVKIISGVLLN